MGPTLREFTRACHVTKPQRQPPGSRSLYAVFLVLTLFFPGVLVSSAYAGNAGSFLLAYPLPVPTKQYQVIETTYPLPAPEGYALAISATPGEFAPATFVLRAGEALTGVNVQASCPNRPGDHTGRECGCSLGEDVVSGQHR